MRQAAAGAQAGASPLKHSWSGQEVHTFSQRSLLVVAEAAEPLMIRHYRRIDPADQPEVLAEMAWLTTAALSDRSA